VSLAHPSSEQETDVFRISSRLAPFAIVALALVAPVAAEAGEPPAQAAPPAAAATAAATASSDPTVDATQPDFTVITMPTTLELPTYKGYFRLTHRFLQPVNEGGFGGSLGNLFGLDAGARIGLEFRFGLPKGTQVGIYRTSDKTIDLFGQWNVAHHLAGTPISITAVGGVEGTNNFQDVYSPALGAAVSVSLAKRLALHAEPVWVGNTNDLAAGVVDHNDTAYVGIGARFLVTKHMSLVVEGNPRLAGFKGGFVPPQAGSTYEPGRTLMSFGLEGQVGGHVFQLNFSNGFATTPANIARGAAPGKTRWYIGFNLSRKFY
jgi:hypothetical protein